MATETILVRQTTQPILKRRWVDFRNTEDPLATIDITISQIRLIVRPLVDVGEDDVFFDLLAVITDGPGGLYEFRLTSEHTSLRPDVYPGEIMFFLGAPVGAGRPPDDSISVDYIVEQAVKTFNV